MNIYYKKYQKYKSKYLRLKRSMRENSIEDPEDTDMDSINYLNKGVNRPILIDDKDQQKEERNDIHTLTAKNGVEVFFVKKDLSEIDNDLIIHKINPNSSSVLVINNLQTFYKFTDNYTTNYDGQLWVDWEKVNEDFLGLFVDQNEELRKKRLLTAKRKGKKYKSWLNNELDLDYVIYFDRTDNQN